MKQKKGNVISKIIILLLAIMMLCANVVEVKASSFRFSATSSKEEVNPGDTVEVQMSISDIDVKEGINVVEASIVYDETVFDSCTFKNQNEWTTTYNGEEGERKGKFLVSKTVEGVTKEENIGKIKFKLKENLDEMETEIKINKITSNDGKELMDEGNRIIKLKIVKSQETIENKEKPKIEKKQKQDDPIKVKYESGKKDGESVNIVAESLNTGDKVILIVIVALVILLVNFAYFIIKGKSLKEENQAKYRKSMIIAAILSLILMVAVIILARDTVAMDEINIQEMIEKLQKENEDNPESNKYLVTDTTISRIKPESTLDIFKAQIKDVTVNTEENGELKEITNNTEKLKTGMIAKYQNNERTYKISVLGDIDGDGVLNQIELTRDIREYVKSKNWRIEEEIQKISADVTCDGNIDEKDIKAIIKYIVFGKLSVDGVETVKAPAVEVIEGNSVAEGRYNSNVKIKVAQVNEEEKSLKTIYKISGTKQQEEKQINKEEVLELVDEGVYKITSYTYGKLGNKSKGTYAIIVINDKIGVPVITAEPTQWTNGNVKVNITGQEGCNTEYKIDEGEWIQYKNEFEIESNCEISARIKRDKYYGTEVRKAITNIDKQMPTGKIEETGKSASKIQLKIHGQDKELSGIKEIRIFAREEATQGQYTCYQTYTYTEDENTKNQLKEESYMLTGLKAKTVYTIYLEVEDIAGNILRPKGIGENGTILPEDPDPNPDPNPDPDPVIITVETEEMAKPIISINPTTWTNDKVEVTIEGEDEYKTQYKINDNEWSDYTEKFEKTENCMVTARLIEETELSVQNTSEEVQKEITNIDKVLPTGKLELTDVTATTMSLKVQGQDSQLSGIKEMRVYVGDKEITQDDFIYNTPEDYELKESPYYISGLKPNTTYKIYIEVEDHAGNIFSNKDNPLEITTMKDASPIIETTPTEWTNGNVTGTILMPEGYEEKGYNIEYIVSKTDVTEQTEGWLSYDNINKVILEENATIYARLTKGDQKEKIVSKEVTNIDKILPTGTLEEAETKSTSIKVNVNGQDAELSGIKEIRVFYKAETQTEDEYQRAQAYTYTEENTKHGLKQEICEITGLTPITKYKIYMESEDIAGNIYSTKDNALEITTLEDNIPHIQTTPTEWTNGNVTGTITQPEAYEQKGYSIEYILSKTAVTEETEGWQTYNSENKVIVEENTTIYARLANGEEKGEIVNKEVTNIDKENPTGRITNVETTSKTAKLFIEGQDTQLSGIKEMRVYLGEEELQHTFTYDAQEDYNLKNEELEITGLEPTTTYYAYIEVEDYAGNIHSTKDNPTEITTGESKIVAKIVKIGDTEIDEGDTNYEYESLGQAIQACTIAEEQYTILMIGDTKESNTIGADKNIILDLGGHTVTSEATTINNSGKLTIRDRGRTESGSEEKVYGKLSTTGLEVPAINNSETAQITLGQNDGAVEMVPVIEGEKSGIMVNSENSGQLNFYDGVVIGRKTIEGRATDTEDLTEEEKYIVITEKEETEKQKSYLSTPLAYPVRIDNIHYSSLTKAVSVCQEGEIITMLRGIALQDTEEIPEDKSVIIDLNGFTLTSTSTEYVIKNNGTLEIIDSSEGKTGVITNTISDTICNAESGNITISGGTIETFSERNSVINNYGNIVLKENGKIYLRQNSSEDRMSYGIYNNNTGTVLMENGKIEVEFVYGKTKCKVGIYNDNGRVEILDGTINIGGAHLTQGIYNRGNAKIKGGNLIGGNIVVANVDTGTVTISGGKISSNGSTAISNSGDGRINIIGDTIIEALETSTYVETQGIINSNNGIIQITEGELTINTQRRDKKGVGIKNSGTGEIIIGQKGDFNRENPIITNASGIGINNSLGILKYYDGIVKGKESAIYGEITELEDGYKIEDVSTEELSCVRLKESSLNVAQIGDNYYKNIQEAVDSCSRSAGDEITEIIILEDITLIGNSIEVYEGQNIKINLNGRKIRNYINKGAINNNGTLKIYDTNTDKGEISGTTNYMINNNSVITISDINIGAYQSAIYNNGDGVVNINGGTISASYLTTNGAVITNKEEGTINILGGSIITKTGIDIIKNIGAGTIKVTGGVIKPENCVDRSAITNETTGTIIIEGGEIYSNDDAIKNNGNGNIIINDGYINGRYYGVFNGASYTTNAGKVTITGGRIVGKVTNSKNGILIVGQKGGEVSITDPEINGGQNGVENYGTFKFYDGIILGTTHSIYGEIQEIEEGYEIIKEVDENSRKEKAYLISDIPIAKINDKKYVTIADLQQAINNIEESEEKVTIEILRNISISKDGDNLIIPQNKNIEIDLKGFNITSEKEQIIINNGTLNITDTTFTEEPKGSIILERTDQDIYKKLLINNGRMRINKINLIGYIWGTVVENSGTLEISNTNIKVGQGRSSDESKGINNKIDGIVIITDTKFGMVNTGVSTIAPCSISVNNEQEGKISIDGESSELGLIFNKGNGKIDIKNGNIYSVSNKGEGEINLKGGQIKCTDVNGGVAVQNSGLGTINITGGSIYISTKSGIDGNYAYGIKNANNGIVNVESGTIQAIGQNVSGIYNEGEGIVNVTGGTINATYYGVTNNALGEIIIGKKDNVKDTLQPEIKASYYGVYSKDLSGTFKFYDGTIIGAINPFNCAPIEIEEANYINLEQTEDRNYKAYLKENVPIAKIGEIQYADVSELNEAINNLENDNKVTIQLLSTISILNNQESIVIPNNKNVEIKLNRYSILLGREEGLINKGILNIVDDTNSGGVLIANKNALTNEGEISISGIKLHSYIEGKDNKINAINNKENSKINVNENTIIYTNSNQMTFINNEREAIININSGNITAYGKKVFTINNNGTVVLKEGIMIDSDTERFATYSINNNEGGDVSIESGTIGMISNNGNINITGGTISKIFNRGTLNISGGKIEKRLSNSKNTNIIGGIIEGETENNIDATLNIIKGTIKGNYSGVSNSGIMNVGEKGKGVSKTTPIIIGNEYGIHNEGILNFYDGIIKGKTAYLEGTITEVEPYYEVSLSTDEEGYQCATLTLTSQEDMCAVVNGTYYNTIQAAVDAVIGSEPITLVNGVNITEAINIPTGKNITIDLAGFTINSTTQNHAIINNGTLRIMDSSQEKTGAIVNQNGPAIQNNGHLTIDEGVTVTPQ